MDLSRCFQEAREKHGNVLRIDNLEKSSPFGCRSWSVLSPARNMPMGFIRRCFSEFMIWLNRALINNHANYLENEVSNEKIAAIVDYINAHLKDEITVDGLAEHFLSAGLI